MDYELNFKKMRNKLNLKEGEVQRILGLHKKAINENLNIFSTNKPVLSEAVKYSQKDEHPFDRIETATSQKQGEKRIKSFWTPEETKWEETKDGAKTTLDYDTKVFFKCKKYNDFDFLVDEANNGKYVWFKSEKLGSVLRGKFCKNKSADQGSSSSDKEKRQGYGYTHLKAKKVANIELPAQNLYFRCKPYKNGFHFKNKAGLAKNSPLTKALTKVFCESDKTEYKQMKQQTFVDEKNTKFVLEANTIWKWKNTGKEEVIPDPNSGKKEEGKDGLAAYGSSGTRYTFDFETIMKAIDDTGKCPRSGSSDQAGTSGTSGVQGTSGTQGTSGVGAPVVIQKPTVTKDDFVQWTMN